MEYRVTVKQIVSSEFTVEAKDRYEAYIKVSKNGEGKLTGGGHNTIVEEPIEVEPIKI